jgi:hypothetical protein
MAPPSGRHGEQGCYGLGIRVPSNLHAEAPIPSVMAGEVEEVRTNGAEDGIRPLQQAHPCPAQEGTEQGGGYS